MMGLIVTALLTGLQVMIIAVSTAKFFPIPTPDFIQQLFPVNLNDVRPEREILFYHIFVATSLLSAFIFHRCQFKHIRSYRIILAGGIALQLLMIFKMFTNSWSINGFYVALGLTMVSIVFLKEINLLAVFINQYLKRAGYAINHRVVFIVDVMVVLGLIFLLWPTNIEYVLARDYIIDNFYHFDGFIMSSAYAWLKGCHLNIDVISQYSVVLPAVVATLTSWLGGLTYTNVNMLFIGATLVYLWMTYGLLRAWLGNCFIAIFGVFMFTKWHLFHWGVAPIVWMLPGVIPVRYLFDVLVLWLIWQQLNKYHPVRQGGILLITGFAIAYMLDTGIYLWLTVLSFTGLRALLRLQADKKILNALFNCLLAIIIPLGFSVGVLWVFVGEPVFHETFWHNFTEHMTLFLNSWGALPVYDGLKDRNFFAFIMGLTIPVVYTLTVMITVALVFLRRREQTWLFVAIISLYGLALYHYFICRSAVSSYYVVCLPFVLTLCFWLNELFKRQRPQYQFIAGIALAGWAIGALLTNSLFLHYPNIINLHHDNWEQERAYYHQGFEFSDDVKLIKDLSTPDKPVALISSFETEILRQADRKPFFYYFPLITSRPMDQQLIGGTYLHTIDRMKKTLHQLDNEAPTYVFIEKRLFNDTLPPQFLQYFQTVNQLREYLKSHYRIKQEGRYLVALERI